MIIFDKNTIKKFTRKLRYKPLTDKSGVYICRGSRVPVNTKFGDGTRINGVITIKGGGYVEFGKYCAVGEEVRVITSNHDMSETNIQYALQKKIGLDINPINADVIIGNNVWIGDNVIILPGVKVGNGAVIAAGAIVTKDILPYSVAGGNPARHIKFRFEKDKIEKIENSKWWDWSIDQMRSNIDFFKK